MPPQVRAYYARAQAPKLFANDDGLIAYALGYPTMNANGLALDKEAARAAKRSYLLLFDLAYRRGFQQFTAVQYSRGYGGVPVPVPGSDSELRGWFGLTDRELPGAALQLDFVSQDRLFAIGRFVPRGTR
jgi:hypothetical protein